MTAHLEFTVVTISFEAAVAKCSHWIWNGNTSAYLYLTFKYNHWKHFRSFPPKRAVWRAKKYFEFRVSVLRYLGFHLYGGRTPMKSRDFLLKSRPFHLICFIKIKRAVHAWWNDWLSKLKLTDCTCRNLSCRWKGCHHYLDKNLDKFSIVYVF